MARAMQSRNSKLILCPFCFFDKIDSQFCLQNCFFLLAAHFAQISLSKFCQGLILGPGNNYYILYWMPFCQSLRKKYIKKRSTNLLEIEDVIMILLEELKLNWPGQASVYAPHHIVVPLITVLGTVNSELHS